MSGVNSQSTFSLPYFALAWILVIHVVTVLAHITILPIWLYGVSLSCVLWRLQIQQGRLSCPSAFIRTMLVLSVGCLVIIEYRLSLDVESGVALLVTSFSMKLIEMNRRRDAYLQLMLAYFVVATGFLFHTSFMAFCYLSLAVLMISAALIALNGPKSMVFAQGVVNRHLPRSAYKGSEDLVSCYWPPIRRSLIISGQALPVMIALFVFFPRLPPMWALDLGGGKKLPGLSESMSPTDVAKLAGQTGLAFRVNFDGEIPSQDKLYWRGVVFSNFDGQKWSIANQAPSFISAASPALPASHFDRALAAPVFPMQERRTAAALESVVLKGEPIQYEVQIQPTNQRFLFALQMPMHFDPTIELTPDFRLQANQDITKTMSYKVNSYLNYSAQVDLPAQVRNQTLQLPSSGNPRARKYAAQLLQAVAYDKNRYKEQVLRNFKEQPYAYTLNPPRLSTDIVDRFIFDTKQGYCAHYSGAFVYLMRAAGIPARVVGGYLGGEVNSIGQYISVHQFEAHAWAEVWVEGKGWQLVDPTAWVAPERVLDSVQEALRKEGSFLSGQPLKAFGFQNNSFVKAMRHTFDYVNYSWNRNVVGFNADRQMKLLDHYFSAISPTVLVMLAISFIAVFLLLASIISKRSYISLKLSPIEKLYLQFCQTLHKLGVKKVSGETPAEFSERAAAILPKLAPDIKAFMRCFIRSHYENTQEVALSDQKKLNQLMRNIKTYRIKVVFRILFGQAR